MPKIVDKDQRRREIVEAYTRLVVRDGLTAATTRALATELGVSTGALWHYFDGLDEVVQEALRLVFERSDARISAARSDRRGLEALRAVLTEALPQTTDAIAEAYVVVSFWGRGRVFDLDFYEQAKDGLCHVFVEVLAEAVHDGELRPQTPMEDVADLLLSITASTQVETVLGTPLGTERALQDRLVASCLAPWTAAG